MRKTLIGLIAILTMSIVAYSETRIGVFDGQKVVENTRKGKAIAAKLEALGNQKQTRLKTMQADIRKLEKELSSPALNAAGREQKGLELQNKRTAAKRFIEDSQREVRITTEKEMTAFKTEIFPIIQQIGKEKGFTIILEAPAVLYYDPAIDITSEIVKRIDSK